jgi:hypothetical protein
MLDVQDMLKNKMVYYFAVPVVLAVWTMYNSLYLLPKYYEQYTRNVTDYHDAQPLIAKIIELAPERLVQAREKDQKFDYDKAIDKAAKLCGISASKITPNIRGVMNLNRQNVQDATIAINDVKITQLSKFVAISLHLWPDLECQRLKLTRLKGPKDSWKADMAFRYFY